MELTVANTIISQLGTSTGRLAAMLGARSFVGSADSVQFKFAAKARNGANTVRIVLDPSDTYTVEFWTVRGAKMVKRAEFSNVYADGLRALFESETGLYVSL